MVINFLLQVSANGNVLRSEIVGAIKMRVYLSGMPELRLGLNDKVLFESTGRKLIVINYLLYIVIVVLIFLKKKKVSAYCPNNYIGSYTAELASWYPNEGSTFSRSGQLIILL